MQLIWQAEALARAKRLPKLEKLVPPDAKTVRRKRNNLKRQLIERFALINQTVETKKRAADLESREEADGRER